MAPRNHPGIAGLESVRCAPLLAGTEVLVELFDDDPMREACLFDDEAAGG